MNLGNVDMSKARSIAWLSGCTLAVLLVLHMGLLLRDGWLAAFPDILLLLIPGSTVLAYRALYGIVLEEDAQREAINAWLILVCIVTWCFTLFWLERKGQGQIVLLAVDRHVLSIPLFVPFFGFVGGLVFVIDLFRKGIAEINRTKEFAMRLVLGPYVAMVTVAFTDSFEFIQLSNVRLSQAALAFFSGFLVVLALQRLAEWSNEVLGSWRERYRYEPSEIGVYFGLNREDDHKLKRVGLQFLGQLQSLQVAQVASLEAQGGLGSGFLDALRQNLQKKKAETLFESILEQLRPHGIATLHDLAWLPATSLPDIARAGRIDKELLLHLHRKCQELVKIP